METENVKHTYKVGDKVRQSAYSTMNLGIGTVMETKAESSTYLAEDEYIVKFEDDGDMYPDGSLFSLSELTPAEPEESR